MEKKGDIPRRTVGRKGERVCISARAEEAGKRGKFEPYKTTKIHDSTSFNLPCIGINRMHALGV